MPDFDRKDNGFNPKTEMIKNFEQDFFDKPWTSITGVTINGIENLKTSDQKTRYLWDSISSSLDNYIDSHKIPHDKLENETDMEFFIRLITKIYTLNQQTTGCWRDCFPKTAQEVHRANCALGSLIVARALIRSGSNENELEFGFPGPLSHAVIFSKGYYLDQANGIITSIKDEINVNGIKTYRLEVDETDSDISLKIPFRLVPAASVDKGVITLISNLDPMIQDAVNGNAEAQELVRRFEINQDKKYSQYAYGVLMKPSWNPALLMTNPVWQQELAESSQRISGKLR